jgi:protease YdgD
VQDLRPGISGRDHSVSVEDTGLPWDAIGQVNISGYRMLGKCTGTLVASNLVLTAAHCVMDPWAKVPFLLQNIHFLAGVRGARHKGHSAAKCLRFLQNYVFVPPEKILPTVPGQKTALSSFVKDVVAIVLQDRISVTPVTLAGLIVALSGMRLVHAAYPADRRYVLSVQFDCHLLQPGLARPLWIDDCDAHPASSGGPVFTNFDGTFKLAAIMLGRMEPRASIALPISEWIELTRNIDCP